MRTFLDWVVDVPKTSEDHAWEYSRWGDSLTAGINLRACILSTKLDEANQKESAN
jgi:hypothetical protein